MEVTLLYLAFFNHYVCKFMYIVASSSNLLLFISLINTVYFSNLLMSIWVIFKFWLYIYYAAMNIPVHVCW